MEGDPETTIGRLKWMGVAFEVAGIIVAVFSVDVVRAGLRDVFDTSRGLLTRWWAVQRERLANLSRWVRRKRPVIRLTIGAAVR